MTDDPPSADGPENSEGVNWLATRRRLLQGAVASAGVLGLGSIAFGQEDGSFDPETEIVLGGVTQAWEGREPEAIADESNPTLVLVAGETYDLTWENVDGLPHNFAILDGDGEVLENTEIMDEQGTEQSLSFEVTEDMAEYICEVHPSSMRGDIEVREGGETPAGTPTEGTPATEPALVPQGPEIGLQRVAGEPLTQPVAFAVADEERDRRFVADQTGQVYVHQDGQLQEEPFLDISDRLLQNPEERGGFDERGLLGIAFHPNFQENRRFFVRYSGQPQTRELPEDYDHMFILAEYQASEDFQSADPESEQVLLEIPEPQFNHNAGDISFGPDDMLYVTVGDGGGADDVGLGHVQDWYDANEGGNGQDVTENLLGSILRIDVDGESEDRPYGIPDDNPLVGTDGLDEQWAWGFRNPWRMSFNRGELVVADVGQNLWEEIDHVVKGANYGWNVKEGFHCFSNENPNDPQDITDCPDNAPDEAPYDGQPLVDPLLEYPHQVDGTTIGLSVTGGYVYFNDTLSELNGRYVFGDWSAGFEAPNGRLWVADLGIDFGETTGTQTETGTPSGTQTPAEGTPLDTPVVTETPTTTGTPDGTETPADTETPEGTEAATATQTDATPDGATPGESDFEFAMEELVVAGADDGKLNRTVLAFGRDADGELYVLTSTTTAVGGTGEIFKIVPAGEGETIEAPPTPTPTETETPAGEGTETPGGEETETPTNETATTATETPTESE